MRLKVLFEAHAFACRHLKLFYPAYAAPLPSISESFAGESSTRLNESHSKTRRHLTKAPLPHKTMTRWKQPPSYCEDCGQEFKKYKSLERHHENSVCGGRDSKFPCKYTGCSKAYSRKAAADKQYREAHLGQFSPCRSRQRCEHPGCGKTFSRSENFREHRRTQHSSQILEIHCQHPECGRTFKSSDGLKYHQQSSHSNQKPQFPCKHPGCEKDFTQSSGAEYPY